MKLDEFLEQMKDSKESHRLIRLCEIALGRDNSIDLSIEDKERLIGLIGEYVGVNYHVYTLSVTDVERIITTVLNNEEYANMFVGATLVETN